jgi:thiol-disulfide isomerase/thioredoxin
MTLTEITNFQQFPEVSFRIALVKTFTNIIHLQIYDHEKAVVYLYLESCPYCEEMFPIFQRTADLEIFDDIAFFMRSMLAK